MRPNRRLTARCASARARVRAEVERGRLVPILEEFCPRFAGFYVYYPSRRNLAPKLRALTDHLRTGRSGVRG